MSEYRDFLKGKVRVAQSFGFDVPASAIHPMLKPHQRDIVRWALLGGRRAIFAAFGLGKTFCQLEILRLIGDREGGHQLAILPLGVRQEFMRDAATLGIPVRFVRTTEEVDGLGLYLTNYESVRDGKLDVALFNAVSLDEASILRSYGSKTYQTFLGLFDQLPYRFVATATPSPNRYKELIHYAGFLGIMDTGQALTRFFQRDSSEANNLTLMPHMEGEFFAWLHSWALFVQRPSDLGYDDTGYDLPPMEVRYHTVAAPAVHNLTDRDGQGQLVRDTAQGLTAAAAEKRDSIAVRVAAMGALIDGDDQLVIWCDLNAEQDAIEAALDGAGISYSSIYGALSLEECETRLEEWRQRKTTALIAKPVMLGSGVNLQQCNHAIFVGITYKFNDLIQAIHRVHRFLQTRPVTIDILSTENERDILLALQAKWGEDDRLRVKMSEIIREHGLATTGLAMELSRSIGCQREAVTGTHFTAINNDCVEECARMADDSVDLIVTSIPFGNHYEYSASYNDFGHNEDNGKFFDQMDYLSPELLRVLRPGRIAAVHTKDRIRFGNVTGYGMSSVDPFHADCIQHYRRHGFIYMGMITVVTDVVRENNQTYRLGWSEQCKDGTKMGVGSPEYVLLFRKLPSDTSRAYADVRVEKAKDDYTRAQWQVDAHAFWRSSGNRLLTADDLAGLGPDQVGRFFERYTAEHVYDYQEHVAVGRALDIKGSLPSTFMCLAPASHDPMVWHDVQRMRTLNGRQSQHGLQQHICPFQLDVVDRLITRYSNPGDTVLDPFGGLMTVPLRAIELGRQGIGIELNRQYFEDGVAYLQAAEEKMTTPTLFDMLEPAA